MIDLGSLISDHTLNACCSKKILDLFYMYMEKQFFIQKPVKKTKAISFMAEMDNFFKTGEKNNTNT